MMEGSSSHWSNVSEPAGLHDDGMFLIKVQVRPGQYQRPIIVLR